MASNKRSLSIDDYSVVSVAKRRNFPLTIVEKVEILKRKYAGFPVKMICEKFNVSATTIYDIKRQQDKILKRYAESECITLSDKMRMKLAKNVCKKMKADGSKLPTNSKTAIYLDSATENDTFLSFCEDDYAPTHEPTEETRLDFLWSESDLEIASESDNESESESECDIDMSQEKISMDEGTLPQKISIIEGIQPRENISLNEGIQSHENISVNEGIQSHENISLIESIQSRENISLNEGIQLGKCYISFLEEWSFITPHNLKSINRIQKKLRKEISVNESLQSQKNISINEEMQPQADISMNEGIQSQKNISINEEIQPQIDISMYEGIQLGKCYIRFLKQRRSITQENIARISKILDKQIKKWPKHMRQETILDYFMKVPKK